MGDGWEDYTDEDNILIPRRLPVWERVGKWLLDVLMAAVLLVLLAPLMLVIIGAIRWQTRGSAIFKQERIGWRGEPFAMYKFRTMAPEADPYAPAPRQPDDQRITPIGRWLRKYYLDELPQLINVLKGEMSLVGPRPEMSLLVDRYQPWQRQRLLVKPGLTGLWQIKGRKELPICENLQYDFYYIRHRSLSLDIGIILHTILLVLRGRGI